MVDPDGLTRIPKELNWFRSPGAGPELPQSLISVSESKTGIRTSYQVRPSRLVSQLGGGVTVRYHQQVVQPPKKNTPNTSGIAVIPSASFPPLGPQASSREEQNLSLRWRPNAAAKMRDAVEKRWRERGKRGLRISASQCQSKSNGTCIA